MIKLPGSYVILISVEIWKHAKPLVRSIEDDEDVLFISDSIEEKKHTDENAIVTFY